MTGPNRSYYGKQCPYLPGDIVQSSYNNKPYCEIIEVRQYSCLVRYVKSKHGVPIKCRTRHNVNQYWFREKTFVAENRSTISYSWKKVIECAEPSPQVLITKKEN